MKTQITIAATIVTILLSIQHALAESTCGDVGKFQLVAATITHPETGDPIHKILKINTATGDVWELVIVFPRIEIEGRDLPFQVQGWSPINRTFAEEFKKMQLLQKGNNHLDKK